MRKEEAEKVSVQKLPESLATPATSRRGKATTDGEHQASGNLATRDRV